MNLNTDLAKKINDMIGSEIGKSADSGEFLNSMNTISTSLEQKEEKIIKKKIKKSDIINQLSNTKNKMDKPIGKLFSLGKKGETKEATGAGSAGGFVASLSGEMKEKWSQKYKDSINCDNPKGFSQRAHCAGKKKKLKEEEVLKKDDKKEKSDKKEFKEATGSGSAGAYVTPAAWAKSTSKKDWRGKSKTLFPGGKFVQVKKKCKKFPYCNQGDIKALNLTNESFMNKMVKTLSKKHNVSEETIHKILKNDFSKQK
jgi:hypothetical protein